MSGHSKWATIKRKKEAADSKKGVAFTKLANAIALAAKSGADPDLNFPLRLAIDRAKAVNMPNTNIEKAIARGAGNMGGEAMQEVLYEGYGPGGVAIIVEGATDNRNRTYTDVRTAFTKTGGTLAESGAVAYQFERKGIITVETEDLEAATLAAIDAGAEDVDEDSKTLVVYTEPTALNAVRTALSNLNYTVSNAELAYVPRQTVEISDTETANKIIRLLNTLDELDDITNTYTNFDTTVEINESAE